MERGKHTLALFYDILTDEAGWESIKMGYWVMGGMNGLPGDTEEFDWSQATDGFSKGLLGAHSGIHRKSFGNGWATEVVYRATHRHGEKPMVLRITDKWCQ